jgi:hypothetical protein
MRAAKIALTLVVLFIMTFYMADTAFCRSMSLTTTLVITVKAPPVTNLAVDDKNADIIEKLAESQKMMEPQIKAEKLDMNFLGKEIYTVMDKL